MTPLLHIHARKQTQTPLMLLVCGHLTAIVISNLFRVKECFRITMDFPNSSRQWHISIEHIEQEVQISIAFFFCFLPLSFADLPIPIQFDCLRTWLLFCHFVYGSHVVWVTFWFRRNDITFLLILQLFIDGNASSPRIYLAFTHFYSSFRVNAI